MAERNLPGWARRTLVSLIEVVMPRSDDFHPELTGYILDYIDGYLKYFPVHLRWGTLLGMLLLEWGPPFFKGKLKRFSGMSLSGREESVKGWINSRRQIRRELIKGIKGLVMVAYYSHPLVMEHIGYDLQSHIREVTAKEM